MISSQKAFSLKSTRMSSSAPSNAVRSRSFSHDVVDSALTSSDPVDVRKWLSSHPGQRKVLALVDRFLIDLQGGKLLSHARSSNSNQSTSLLVTHRVVNLLRHLIGSTYWKSAAELICLVRGIGQELHICGKFVAIGNIVRRVIATIREETEAIYQEETKKQGTTLTSGRLSLDNMLWALPQQVRKNARGGRSLSSSGTNSDINTKKLQYQSDSIVANRDRHDVCTSLEEQPQTDLFPSYYFDSRPDLKQTIMEGIQEISTDLEDFHKNINEQASNHIFSGEVVLTIGQSKTVELFLKSVAKCKRLFQVIIVVSGAGYNDSTYEMAKSLTNDGIETTVINQSAVFAVMARVHKVLLPARAVLANGGLVSSVAGSNLVAIAAKHHAIPVNCVTGLFKLCPRYPHEGQDTLNELLGLAPVLGDDEEFGSLLDDVEYINPANDYIEPRYIKLYITNVGSFQPSFIYRMLAENYYADDWDSF
jgi:translation initiation factor eIF-2B subunit beta